ncbi:MAG: BamA/TamA family outer membrane protein [Armatimonadia bacterium]
MRTMRLLYAPLLTALVGLLMLGGLAQAQTAAPLISEVRVDGAGYVSADFVRDVVKGILAVGMTLTPEKIAAAEKEIAKQGYYDKVTISQRVTPTGVQVIITVVEKKRIEKILFVGNTVMSDEKLLGIIKSQPGGLVDNRLAERDAARIQETYTKAGYFAQVSRAEVDNFGVLTFVIEEARVEAVKISGLKRTKEHVVKRQINLKPGELFQDRRVTENIHRIYDLGIFKNVTSDVLQGQVDPVRGVIIEFKIEEGRTGQAQLALAYSNLDNLVMMVSWQENNFRGEAEKASVSCELFGRTSYDVSYVEPYWDEKGTSLELSIFDTERRRQFVGGAAVSTANDKFDERREGGSIRLSRPLDEEGRNRVSLRFRSEKVSSSYFQGTRTLAPVSTTGVDTQSTNYTDYADVPVDNPDLLPDTPEPGDINGPLVVAAPLHPGGRLSSLTFGYTNDLRDSRSNTTRGAYSSFSAEVAGSFFGGETSFRKVQGEHRRYYTVREKDVLALRVMGGISIGDLPLFESYSVGGANTLRGYEEDRFRGKRMLLGTVEYRHPLSASLSIVGFVDAGDAFGGRFDTPVPGFTVTAEDEGFSSHVGAGVGMRVDTPLGPLRLDFGWGDEGSQAHFSFGQTF